MAIETATRDRWRREVEREFAAPPAARAWRAWHDTWVAWTRPLTERLLDAARLGPGQRVLDVGSGTGDPALAIATRIGPAGEVVATDPAADLLATAAAEAARAGLANLATEQADVEALPFPDASFDRATCRLGAMYFLDPVAGLAEMRRVLRPGGRAAVLAWGDPGRATTAPAFFGPILRRLELPPPEPGAPHPYRFAAPGSLGQAMTAAGFRAVEERAEMVPLPFPGSAEEYLRWFREVAIPMDFVWARLGPQESERTAAEIVANLRPFEASGALAMDVEIVLAAGTR